MKRIIIPQNYKTNILQQQKQTTPLTSIKKTPFPHLTRDKKCFSPIITTRTQQSFYFSTTTKNTTSTTNSTTSQSNSKDFESFSASHPWISGKEEIKAFPSVEGFSSHDRVLTFLAANTAAGNQNGVALDWNYIHPQDQGRAYEIILQTHLFCGFPRVINALATIEQLNESISLETETSPSPWKSLHKQHREDGHGVEYWASKGEETARQIYGDSTYARLRDKMKNLHPALDKWMIETGYGRVMSRFGVDISIRELCAVAVLAGMSVEPQLISHIRGALRNGISREHLYAVIQQTGRIWGNHEQDRAEAAFNRCHNARFGL